MSQNGKCGATDRIAPISQQYMKRLEMIAEDTSLQAADCRYRDCLGTVATDAEPALVVCLIGVVLPFLYAVKRDRCSIANITDHDIKRRFLSIATRVEVGTALLSRLVILIICYTQDS